MYNEQKCLENLLAILNKIKSNTICEIDENVKEMDINVSSKDFFHSLLSNLLYYYKQNKMANIITLEQKYFISTVVDILNIINANDKMIFFDDKFVQSILIYLIDCYKEPKNLENEFVLKIILGFESTLEYLESKEIKNEITAFEKDIVNTLRIFIAKYQSESEINFNFLLKKNNLFEIIRDLKKKKPLPLYLKGFIEYFNKKSLKKFLIIKLYKYFQIINPFDKDKPEYNLFLGYSLYGISTYKQELDINFDIFNKMKNNRIKDGKAKDILISSIQLLSSKNYKDFLDKLENEKIISYSEEPRISKSFDNTEEYYEDLYKQLNYSLLKYKKNKGFCKIQNENYSKVLWLNLCKILLLYLDNSKIETDNIKVLFYFIVNLFSPDTDDTSLEFRKDAVPTLFSLCPVSEEILDNQIILKFLDKEYSNYYLSSTGKKQNNTFNQLFIEYSNEEILKRNNVKYLLETNKKVKIEVDNLLKVSKILPFPLIENYLTGLKENINIGDMKAKIYPGLFSFYKNCFYDIEDENDQINFICTIMTINDSEREVNFDDINKILSDNDFLKLINEIMKSNVMNDAYKIINEWYKVNGKFDIMEEKPNLDVKINDNSNQNLINKTTIYDYYIKFCEEINKLDYKKTFIVMSLPKEIKGFTFRFLRIVLNCNGIEFKNNCDFNKVTLLKAYLIFVIIHEQNHFIKKYFSHGIISKLCGTPKIDEVREGGKQLMQLLFGHHLIHNCLNVDQARYIINPENWEKKSVFEFRNDFLKNANDNNNSNNSIVYLTSESENFCDHSKLNI